MFLIPDLTANAHVFALLGALVLLVGEIFALANWRSLPKVLIYSTVAECGFVVMGLFGGELGQLGGGMHLVYQAVMRTLVILALAHLAQLAGGWHMRNLTGIGRAAPIYAIAFAFGMFSLLGLSPFKGAQSRFLMLYDFISHGQWMLAMAGTVASIIAAIYAIRIIQGICFAEPEREHRVPVSQWVTPLNTVMLSLVMITAIINFTPEPVAAIANLLFATAIDMPHFEGPWPLLATIPYIGAFGLFLLAYLSPTLRDVAAVLLGFITLALVIFADHLDPISYAFALLFAGIALVVTLYSTAYMRHEGGGRHYFFFLYLMIGSLMGVATSSDLGSFYLFWELMTWSSYLLIVHSRSREALKAGAKYFIMCAGGAYVMHLGIVGVAVEAGSFDFADLATGLQGIDPAFATLLIGAFLIGFGVKAGFVPLHGWLPVAHPAAPSSVSAPLSSILTKTGIVGLLKVVFGGFGIAALGNASGLAVDVGLVICLIGVVTLLYGEVMAWRQQDIKRMLAYSTIAQVGEIAAVLGIGTSLAIAGASAHVLTHGLMKTLLFLAAGALIYRIGSRKLSDMAGIGRQMPLTALFFVVGLLAIMGLPPFAGFISKFLMIYASVEAGAHLVAVALLLGGLIGILYYSRIIRVILFDPSSALASKAKEAPLTMLAPLGILAPLILGFGLMPEQLLGMAGAIAQSITGPLGDAEIVIAALLPSWPFAAIVCAAGGVLTLTAGRKSRATAGALAVGTTIVAAALIIYEIQRYDFLMLGFALVVTLIGALNLLYTVGYFAHHGSKPERFMGMFVLMIGGLVGMAGSQDLFSFFFFWEIMSSWTLYFAIIHEESPDALDEGFKYFTFNMAGASFLFLGVTVLASSVGTFEFSVLADSLTTLPVFTLVLGLGAAVIGFAMKAAMFTMRVDYQMHPATAPTPVSGYISAVLLKSGPIGALVLLTALGGGAALSQFGEVFGLDPIGYFLALLGAVTAIYAGLMAFIQVGIKRLLIYSTVAQLGYVMCGLALADPISSAGGLAHAFNHALLKNTLFLAAGAILAQQHITSLDELGGAGRRMPWTFAMFMFAGLSLAGLPPLNGLASKWLLYEGALSSGHPFIALLLMGASLTTLAAVLKFLHAGFFGAESPVSKKLHEAPPVMLVPMAVLTVASVLISLFPGLLLVPVSLVQASLGLTAIDVTWFGPLPGEYGWHPLALIGPMLILIFVGWLYMRLGRRAVSSTHAHTCGVDASAGRIRVSASHLYSSPGRLVRKALLVRGSAS